MNCPQKVLTNSLSALPSISQSGKGIYTTAVTELQRIEQRRSPNSSQKAKQNALEYLVIHLAEQMGAYVRAKQEMMD